MAVAAQNVDWSAKRKTAAETLKNANPKNSSIQQLAVYHYEYGRALGVTCSFALAEKHLLKAYQLDLQSSGPVHFDLLELARLNHDQNKHAKAVSYYEKALQILDKRDFGRRKVPVEYAHLLNEYSISLRVIGQTAKAQKYKLESEKIRKQSRGRYSITDRTPYGKHCR